MARPAVPKAAINPAEALGNRIATTTKINTSFRARLIIDTIKDAVAPSTAVLCRELFEILVTVLMIKSPKTNITIAESIFNPVVSRNSVILSKKAFIIPPKYNYYIILST
jgi:hypothetical protein